MGRLSSGRPSRAPAPAVQQQTVSITLGIYFWALKVKRPPVSCRSLELCLSEELGLDRGLNDSPDGGWLWDMSHQTAAEEVT